MSTMITKGITPTGAVEVALGRSLSSQADRSKLQRLDLPEARTSLSKPISTGRITAGTSTRLTPKQVAWQVMEAAVHGRTVGVLQGYWAKQRAEEQAAIAAAKKRGEALEREARKQQDEIERLRKRMDDHARRAGDIFYHLGRLFLGKPFWPWEWDNWHRQAGNHRGSLEDLEDQLYKAAQDMDRAREKMLALK